MTSRLKVTVEDLDTGETETRTLENDWTVICGDPFELHHVQSYSNGTCVVTIKRASAPGSEEPAS